MAQKGNTFGPVLTDRIISMVRRVGDTPLRISGPHAAPLLEDWSSSSTESSQMKIGKTTSEWVKNTLATIMIYDQGTPPNETMATPPEYIADCINKFGSVEANKWVGIAKASNDRWYLVAAEC